MSETRIRLQVETEDPTLVKLIEVINSPSGPAQLKQARGELLMELGRTELMEAGYERGHRDGVDEADSRWIDGSRLARAIRGWRA